jgi:hypothetical protein
MNLTDEQRADFRDIQERAENLRETYGERDKVLEETRKMMHLEWTDRPDDPNIKETLSTTPFDVIQGGVRLMTSTDPEFNINYDEADTDLRAIASDIESMGSAMWSGSGRVFGRPVHHEMFTSSLWAGEIVGTVSRTAEVVAATTGMTSRKYLRQAEQALRETPYLFKIHNPYECYTEYSALGASAVLRRSETNWGEVYGMYGAAAEDVAFGVDHKSHEHVTVYDWTDWDYRAVWISGASEPLIFEAQTLDFMPIVSAVSDGSFLFSEPHLQRTPILYGLYKSGMWRRENLMLSVIYTLAYGVGSSPQLVHETTDPDNAKLQIRRDVAGGVISIEKGDRLTQLLERVIDPSQMQGLATAQQYSEGTTIPRVALGAPPSGNLAFSAISLMVQSGRLPLMGPKEAASYVAAELVRRALLWTKRTAADGIPDEFYNRKGRKIQLDPSRIPDRLPLECVMEVSLPADKLQQVNAANGLADRGAASMRWIREKVLGIGNNEAMEREIAQEKFTERAIALYLDRMSAQAQASMQQMQQAQGAASAQSMVNGIPDTRPPMPAEISSSQGAYPPGGVQPGAPMAGPLPPRGQA